MTTTITVRVNGPYRATVRQDDREPVTVEGNWNGGTGEQSFSLPHPATGTFAVSEESVPQDEQDAARAAKQEQGDGVNHLQPSPAQGQPNDQGGFAGQEATDERPAEAFDGDGLSAEQRARANEAAELDGGHVGATSGEDYTRG